MEIQGECYPCILNMVRTVAARTLGEQDAAEFMAGIERAEAFHGNPAGLRAPMVVRDAWADLLRRVDDPDPLAELKRRQNEAALAVLPAARAAVAAAEDPLAAAAALSIVGNSLDVLTPGGPSGDALLARLSSARVDGAELAEFRRRLGAAHAIAYLGDNCGEAVFDRLLIETLDRLFDVDVVFIVRARPVLNDVTMTEALAIGLDRVARVIDNGIDDALPSTLLELLGPEARSVVRSADLVISKGGGNFEMLDGHPTLAGRVSFLVDGKCDPLCRHHGVAAGTPVLFNQ